MKSIVIVIWFFHPAPKFETLARRTQLRKKEISARKEILIRIKKNKIKKKVAKLSSGFTKSKFKPCGFFKKSPPPLLLRLNICGSLFFIRRVGVVVFFKKNLLF